MNKHFGIFDSDFRATVSTNGMIVKTGDYLTSSTKWYILHQISMFCHFLPLSFVSRKCGYLMLICRIEHIVHDGII